ncbi:hypothetical protein EYC80_002357 [Monilinia laxa]|uniref:Uncharacterized protein n=1 Tax=Monilinia laxa TaxID=61186 RepID=A0A5N6K3T2_MONLA|nr:hypothetical protein EYC80_002357 [Monilinia laxa]
MKKRPYATYLKPMHVCKDETQDPLTDITFFKALKRAYLKERAWKDWLILKLKRIEFVGFKACPGDFVDHIKPNDLPPTTIEYDFTPPPPPKMVPPIGPEHMLHLFQNCPSISQIDSDFYLQRIPRRKIEPIVFKSHSLDDNLGWGLHFVEGINTALAITVMFTLSSILGIVFAICWTIFEKDVQGAFGVAAYITSVITLAAMTWQMWTLTSKVAVERMYCSRYHVFTLLCLWWSSSIGCAVADDHGVVFLYPTENLTFHYLDTIDVTYTSPFPKPQLWIFCQNATDVTSGIITESKASVNPYNGTAPVNFKWLGGSPCWFDIKPDNKGGLGANSAHFVVDQNKRATPTTLGLDSLTTTATSTPTASSDASNDVTTTVTSSPATSSEASSDSTSSSQNTSPKGLSGGAKAGIGIGSALVALLALAGAFSLWRRKQQANQNNYAGYEQGMNEKVPADGAALSPDYSTIYPQETVAYEMYAPENQYEMPGTRPVVELSGDARGKVQVGGVNVRELDESVQSPTLGRGS